MPLVTRQEIIAAVEKRLRATKQFEEALGGKERREEVMAGAGAGLDGVRAGAGAGEGHVDGAFYYGKAAETQTNLTIDPRTKEILLAALKPSTPELENPLRLQTINEVIDIFEGITRQLLTKDEDIDQVEVEGKMAPFAAAGNLRNFIHQQFEKDPEKVRKFLRDFLGAIRIEVDAFYESDLGEGVRL
jgi:hypothetical protein